MSEAVAKDGHDDNVITETPNESEQAADQGWTQYVTFAVDGSSYGIEITKVREIKGWSEPVSLPHASHAMRGVLNLRGVIVPIYDLRAHFGRGMTVAQEEHVIIITMLGDRLIGVLVDAVSDILTLEPHEILPVPAMGLGAEAEVLSGLVSRDEQLVALLKLEALFGNDAASAELTF